jgi:hypothetical protein
MRDIRSLRFNPVGGRPHLLHVEAPGCIVNIHVGLTDRHGRAVTAVFVLPDDETRGGDQNGRIWRAHSGATGGVRVVRLKGRRS